MISYSGHPYVPLPRSGWFVPCGLPRYRVTHSPYSDIRNGEVGDAVASKHTGSMTIVILLFPDGRMRSFRMYQVAKP